jgi:hypothetical protein
MFKRMAVLIAATALAAGALVASPARAAVGTTDAPCPPNGSIVLGSDTVPSFGVSEFKTRLGGSIKVSHSTFILDKIGCFYNMAYPSIKLTSRKKNGVVTYKWSKAPGIKVDTVELKFLHPVTRKPTYGTISAKTKEFSVNSSIWPAFKVHGRYVPAILVRVSFLYNDYKHLSSGYTDTEAYPDPLTA